jgi:hypothetical protein
MKYGKTFSDVMNDATLQNKSQKMETILENVWNVGKLTKDEYKFFESLIRTQNGRKLFRGHLNKYRISHRKMLNDRSFKTLKRLFWVLLDRMKQIECDEREDDEDMLGRK